MNSFTKLARRYFFPITLNSDDETWIWITAIIMIVLIVPFWIPIVIINIIALIVIAIWPAAGDWLRNEVPGPA